MLPQTTLQNGPESGYWPTNCATVKNRCAVEYSPRGDKFASGGSDDIIRLWSKDSELLIEISGHDNNAITSLPKSFSPMNAILSAPQGSGISRPISQLKTNSYKTMNSPDAKYVASGGSNAKIYVWSLEAMVKQEFGDPASNGHGSRSECA